jgi:hypothetical protein
MLICLANRTVRGSTAGKTDYRFGKVIDGVIIVEGK